MVEAPVRSHSLEPVQMDAESFYRVYEAADVRAELVRGVVQEMSPVNPIHAAVESEIHDHLKQRCKRLGGFRIYPNAGFILARNPDVVRAPDLAVVAETRRSTHPRPERGYWQLAPDLVVEIISPGDGAEETNGKVWEYVEAGVRLVWVFYPKQRTVHVFHLDGRSEVVLEAGTLRGEEVLPGFELPMGEFWKEALA